MIESDQGRKKVSRDKRYWTENDGERLNQLKENCNIPWKDLRKMFDNRTRSTLKGVMQSNGITRDREIAPNVTKLPKKWTPEKAAELREHCNDPWPELIKRFGCSMSRLENKFVEFGIHRNRPDEIVWTKEADRILVDTALESHQFRPHKPEGRQELRKLFSEMMGKFKGIGFEGSTGQTSILFHLHRMNTERLREIGFETIEAPVGWGLQSPQKANGETRSIKEIQPTAQGWFLILQEKNPKLYQEFREGFLSDYRKDCRIKGNTNADLLARWKSFGCPNIEGLKFAAKHLGETRNRIEIAHEYKTIEEAERIIEGRFLELVRQGNLLTLTPESLCSQVRQEFSSNPAYSRYTFTDEQLGKLLDRATWTHGPQGTLAAFKEFVISGAPLEKFLKHHPYLATVAGPKYHELLGETNIKHPPSFTPARAVPGVLRFLGEEGMKGREDFELPVSGPLNPYDTGITGKNWRVRFLNAPNLGLLHERLIEVNPPRRSLAQAEYEHFNKVFLTNVFTINTIKAAGPSRVLKALFEGLYIDEEDVVNVFDPSYHEKVLRILREHPDDEVFYETHEEMLKDVVRGLRKITLKPDGTPEFSGPISYILGMSEERIIVTATYWHVHYVTRIKQSNIKAELMAAESALSATISEIINEFGTEPLEVRQQLKDARRQYESATEEQGRGELSGTIENLETRLRELLPEDSLHGLEEDEREVQDLRAEEARTRISTVAPQEWKRFYQKALAGFVKLVESAVPNLKVIGKGTTYVKIGSKRGEINIPGNERVTDRHISAYADVYGGRVLRGEMADFVVICPQYPLNFSLTSREVDNDGARGSAILTQAPMCVNADFLRKGLKTIVQKSVQPIGRAVFNEQCQTGVLDLISTDDVVSQRFVSIPALAAYERMEVHLKLPSARRGKNNIVGKVIRIVVATDQHWGGQSKEFLRCPECGINLGMLDAVFHMWRKAGYGNGTKLPPCHFCVSNDDPTQGHHFDAEHQPHPHELIYPDIEKLLRESFVEFRETRNLTKRSKLEELLIRRIQYQFLIRGVYCTTNQMMLLLKQHLQPNIDMYDGILRRAVESGLTLRGISHFLDRSKVIKDTRDIAFILEGTGNHFIKTTEGNISEGPIYAELIKAHLLQQPYWQERADLVEKYVRGPVYGNQFISFGTVQAPGGYEYGLDFRNTPPGKGVDWGNPLRFCAQNDLRRGNYARIFQNKLTIKTYGDKHFLSCIITSNAAYLMGPASTHTDVYGELGFPPNGTGIVFADFPAEGPDAGPITIRQLMYDDIKKLVEGGYRSFDWEAFLPNAL